MAETYYTIKDVADRTGMSPTTLRFYDKKGLLSFVKRSASGIRMFTEEDFQPLYTIHCLKRAGMSLEKIREFMDLYLAGNHTIPQRRLLFEQQREVIKQQIQELNEVLDVVEYKCWFFAEAEKYGDVYYYRNLPEDQIPERMVAFSQKVKEFHSQDLHADHPVEVDVDVDGNDGSAHDHDPDNHSNSKAG